MVVMQEITVPVKSGPVFAIVCEVLYNHSVQNDSYPSNDNVFADRIYQMASAWKVISFFAVVFILPTVLISLPLYARYHLYSARHWELADTDTAALDDAVSSFWCQGQRVSSNGSFDGYLLDGTPRIKDRRRTESLSSKLRLQYDDIKVWGLYLLKGSSFALSSCSRWPGGVLLIVQGEENLKRCFYSEERLEEELNGDHSPHPKNTNRRPMVKEGDGADQKAYDGSQNNDPDSMESENVGGEIFDDGEVFGGEGDAGSSGEKEVDEVTQKINPKHVLSLGPILKSVTISQAEDTRLKSSDRIGDYGIKALPRGNKEENDDHIVEDFRDDKISLQSGSMKSSRREKARGSKKHRKQPKNRKSKHKKESTQKMREEMDGEALPKLDTEGMSVRRSLLKNKENSRKSSTDSKDAVRSKRWLSVTDEFAILHTLNNTLDVTVGNSSISSSEEFLEQCSQTILSLELNPYPDCPNHLDLNESMVDYWKISVNESDHYYFIFTSDNSLELNYLFYKLQLERSVYDVTSPLITCANATECVFPLSFLQTEAVVVEMSAEESLKDFNKYEMVAVCQPRVAVYTIFLLLVPFIILLFAFQ